MLNQKRFGSRSDNIVVRSLTNDPTKNSMSLGCPSCPHFRECGGLSVEADIFDCTSLCCGMPEQCSRVCRNKSEAFVAQLREVNNFNLDNIPRAPVRTSSLESDVVELIYHGSCRETLLAAPTVALRLADLVDYRNRCAKFSTRLEMCAAFRVDPASNIILTGVDHDARIEPWWSLSYDRIPIIRSLERLGIMLVTTPNFSLLLDNPRTDDMHAMKRIAATFSEFQQEGLSCALHPNSRTERDFDRWTEFVSTRHEVSTLSYEFITGSGRASRRQFHIDGLIRIAKSTPRPLDVVVRGDPQVIPTLRDYYREVIYVDTTAFMKAQKRFLAERTANDGLSWNRVCTEPGSDIGGILQVNFDEQSELLRAKYFGQSRRPTRAA